MIPGSTQEKLLYNAILRYKNTWEYTEDIWDAFWPYISDSWRIITGDYIGEQLVYSRGHHLVDRERTNPFTESILRIYRNVFKLKHKSMNIVAEAITEHFRYCDRDTIFATMQYALFAVVKRYRLEGPTPILEYLTRSFWSRFHKCRYLLLFYQADTDVRQVPIQETPVCQLMDDDDKKNIDYNKPWVDEVYTDCEDKYTVDTDWVLGYTADIFAHLSVSQRHMLKRVYADELGLKGTAGEMGVNRVTYYRFHLYPIINELSRRMIKLRLVDGDGYVPYEIYYGNDTNHRPKGWKKSG